MKAADREVHAAYGTWVERLIAEGWDPYLVTFMFSPLLGSPTSKWLQMEQAIDRVYGRILTRMFRKPNAPANRDRLPILLAAADLPVFKYDRDRLSDVVINDGLHVHGVWLMPRWTRMQEGLAGHFLNYGPSYSGKGKTLARIHCQPIEETPAKAMDYVLKTVNAGRVSNDAVAVWPRSQKR